MIASFKCRETEKIWNGRFSKKWQKNLQTMALEQLIQLDAVQEVEYLQSPPSNYLKKLSGKRKGQWSIRVNKKYRICFLWQNGSADNIELVDYH